MNSLLHVPTSDHPGTPGARVQVEKINLSHPREDIFFAAVETTRMPMLVSDPNLPDNPVVFANQAFIRMTGYTLEEVVGRNCRFLQGRDTDPAAIAEVREAVAARREIAIELINYRKDGSSFWNALYVSPVYDKQGELAYFFSSQLDVSRRRDAEDALRQAQKMEALGQLTGGIAHDFNNLLQVTSGYLEGLAAALEQPALDRDKLARYVQTAQRAVQRAGTLTQQLLAFARKQRLVGRVVNANEMVGNLREVFLRTLGEHATLELDLAPDLWNCRLDTTQAEIALLNIVSNAREAMAGRAGCLTVRTRNVEVGAGDSQAYPDLQAGRYVTLVLADNGCGMPPDVRQRVMLPFFTTKEEGQGTGLGLSMVYGFARQSGGTVRLESEEGAGTTVSLFFPATADARQPGEAPGTAGVAAGRPGQEKVLVVDDRADVAELAKEILEDYGYTVWMATGGAEALAMIEQGLQIDLLLTDLIMPGSINGVVLARRARERMPGLRVLLSTGYADASIEHTDIGGSEFDVIHKPYGRSALAHKVRSVLDTPVGID